MKNFLIIVFLFSASTFFSVTLNEPERKIASGSNFDTLEVFVSITYNDPSVFSKVKATINSLSGTSYYCYCSNHAVMLVYVDKTVFSTADKFLEMVMKKASEYNPLVSIKQGSFKDLVGECVVFNPGEANAIKKDFGK